MSNISRDEAKLYMSLYTGSVGQCQCPNNWITFQGTCYYFGHGHRMHFSKAEVDTFLLFFYFFLLISHRIINCFLCIICVVHNKCI